VEVVPYVGDQLGVARVVQGLDAKDLCCECVIVLVHVADEVELRGRRANDQDLARVPERLDDLVKVGPLSFGAPALRPFATAGAGAP